MRQRLTKDEAEASIKEVRLAGVEDRVDFVRLVDRARLDPGKDLRYGNFSGVNFAGCNLEGFDFTGACLVGCNFVQARIGGARFTQTEFSPYAKGSPFSLTAADDWLHECLSACRSGLELPQNRDAHIRIGAWFRDQMFSPLMKCVAATQPNGVSIKCAVALELDIDEDSREVFQETIGNLYSGSMPDYIDWLNETVHDYHGPSLETVTLINSGATLENGVVLDRTPSQFYSDLLDTSKRNRSLSNSVVRRMGSRVLDIDRD
jgi:hypothetical protein